MDPLIYFQQSFLGGMNMQLDPTRLAANEYPLLINGRNRFDTVQPIPSTVKSLNLPMGNKIQGIYAAGNFLLTFIDGKAYFRDVSQSQVFNLIPGLQMSIDADVVFAELVPASTVNFQRVPAIDTRNSDIKLTSAVTGTPQAVVVQDGVSTPWLILSDLTVRPAKNYNDWDSSDLTKREYVPIMRQMLWQDSILYGVSPDKKFIYRSVSGRPLDFMVNIDKDGNKLPNEADGGAQSVAFAVDYDDITALNRLNTPNGSFFISTRKNSYIVTPNYDDQLFGEPTFDSQFLFSTGCLNNFSMIDILGDSALIDFAGVRSFNAILQTFNEGRNAPFSLKVAPLFRNVIQTVTAAIEFDNFGLFAVNTIFGPAVLVYDTITKNFVGIDIYANLGGDTIKQFAEVKTTNTTRKLFFITSGNELYEAFGDPVNFENCQLYLGEWCSNDPKVEQKAELLKLIYTDVRSSGNITITPYIDREANTPQTQPIVKTSDTPVFPVTPPFAPVNSDNVKNVAFPLDLVYSGWKVGFFIVWDFDATLSHVRLESTAIAAINTDESAALTFS